ncbi:hypothetical protein BJ684DRAFT_20267 [Piptocephalis cylindrospora]|uniref:Ion transport domain-containing protein n=1 Tax=Piptocephalis cylindrospora TaxID=1907219 RepID=A0A4P9Y2S6_9FUNG|nr:hypothetical protein BJ684DRAFT_20267 [Piptocephalis cylindrospora]|eukprot:RKP13226.1 hypothetical protein BJ684DRAFT_20267 [Piptocephalis cylindrospora]
MEESDEESEEDSEEEEEGRPEIGGKEFRKKSTTWDQASPSRPQSLTGDEEASELAVRSSRMDISIFRQTMRLLQLMVEGHHARLQAYLHEQPDNIKSFDLVKACVDYLHALLPILGPKTVRLLNQVLDTITEMAQGCPTNQATIFACKYVTVANTLLSEPYYQCDPREVREMKDKVVTGLLSLLETTGQSGKERIGGSIGKEMAISLDMEAISKNIRMAWEAVKMERDQVKTASSLASPALSLTTSDNPGFQYAILILSLYPRLLEVDPDSLERDGSGGITETETDTALPPLPLISGEAPWEKRRVWHGYFSLDPAFAYYRKKIGRIEVVGGLSGGEDPGSSVDLEEGEEGEDIGKTAVEERRGRSRVLQSSSDHGRRGASPKTRSSSPSSPSLLGRASAAFKERSDSSKARKGWALIQDAVTAGWLVGGLTEGTRIQDQGSRASPSSSPTRGSGTGEAASRRQSIIAAALDPDGRGITRAAPVEEANSGGKAMGNTSEPYLTTILFPIPEVCSYLREDSKSHFLWRVRRDSPSAKVEDFVNRTQDTIFEIRHQARLRRDPRLTILADFYGLWWRGAYALTTLLNLLALSCFVSLPGTAQGKGTAGGYGDQCTWRGHGMVWKLSGLIHLIFWCLCALEFVLVQLPVLLHRRTLERMEGKRKKRRGSPWGKEGLLGKLDQAHLPKESKTTPTLSTDPPGTLWGVVDELYTQGGLPLIREPRVLYHAVMLLLSISGLAHPAFYALHLLDYVYRDEILQGVIASVTLNRKSLVKTGLLGVIILYLYGYLSFLYFRPHFDSSQGHSCHSLLQCFITVFSYGVRAGGGLGDLLIPPPEVAASLAPGDTFSPTLRILLDMSFYLIVTIFLLNVIFGIIFDTFGTLRDRRSAIQKDMKHFCFICSIPAQEFQKHGNGFEYHIQHEHNMWQYLFFLVHLQIKDRTEYTSQESYVSDMLQSGDYAFFPINRSLSLRQREDGETDRLKRVEGLLETLLDRITHLEISRDDSREHVRRRTGSIIPSSYHG